MAATPAGKNKNTVHWAPSPALSLSDTSSTSTSSITSTSSLQYINAQLVSHGFALPPGLSLDGLSTADAEGMTKCLLSMLGQRVDDMTRAEELTNKLRTLSYDHERLRAMHGAATETAEGAEREAAAARAKLTIANRAQAQAEAAQKQAMGELLRARGALQALRATHGAELKRREKEVEAMRERWSRIADAQLRMAGLPSGMTAAANAPARLDGGAAATTTTSSQKGLVEGALGEAERACALLRGENGELKALVVDAANAVRKILHKVVSSDPDDLEFPPPLATNDLFPLGTPDAAFERLSALLTSLRDALVTLRDSSETPAATSTSASNPKPQISPADLAKKAAESDAKAHKWETEELRTTIAGLRDELRKLKAERKMAPATRSQDVPVEHDKLASHLPPTTDEAGAGPSEPQRHDTAAMDSKPDNVGHATKKGELFSIIKPTKRAPAPAAQPGPSRLSSPRKTRSKSKAKVTHKSPVKATRASASSVVKRSASRPRRLTSKRVETSFETEVIPSTVPASLLPTSFVLPPPSPESRLPPHPAALTPSVPPLLVFPSTTTPPFPPPNLQPPPVASSSAPARETLDAVVPGASPPTESSSQSPPPPPPPPPPKSKPFPLAKPLARNMSHAYSPAKPSPLSRILNLAESPDGHAAAATAILPPVLLNLNPHNNRPAAPVFEPPPPVPPPTSVPAPTPALAPAPAPAPAPLRTGTTSNAAGTQRRRASSKRTSREAELDLDADGADAHAHAPRPNRSSDTGEGVDVDAAAETARDPRAPEKENTIRRRLKGGPAAVGTGGPGTRTRKMTAAAAAAAAATTKTKTKAKSESSKLAAPAAASAHAPVFMAEPTTTSVGVGGAAGRLLAAARGSTGGGGTMASGPRRVPIDSTEAAAGLQARRVS